MTPTKVLELVISARKAGAVLALCVAMAIGAAGQTFTTVFSFDLIDGSVGLFPDNASLVQGFDGNFYGTTEYGAHTGCAMGGCGSAFVITPAGKLTTLYGFCSQANCTDGFIPYAGLVQATNGNFYGTTSEGGTSINAGTIFEITPQGKRTTMYNFCSQSDCLDGDFPEAPLVQATDGNLYGTTVAGGAYNSNNGGTIFEMTPAGELTTLYSFCFQPNCADGLGPYAGLVQASNGNFYGTTNQGGANLTACPWIACGTIFEITPAGKLTTLYSFCSQPHCTDGFGPVATLVQASNGNFYGTTVYGGANYSGCAGFGCGTIFEITPQGKLTTLYSFCSQPNCTDGWDPYGGVVQATDGKFYGTTVWGGANSTNCSGWGCGTIFEITPAGELTTLHSFCSPDDCTDGTNPWGLLQATNGDFLGTAVGGAHNSGTIFSESVGLQPFIETMPTMSEVGAPVIILGNDLEDTTGVSFNGVAAAFTVVSATEITTTVPRGATSGSVTVTTPARKLTSNKIFRVRL